MSIESVLEAPVPDQCEICAAHGSDVLVATESGRLLYSAKGLWQGHVIAATSQHAEAFRHLSASELELFMTFLGRAVSVVEDAIPGAHCYVLRVGDKAPHLHFHIIPRIDNAKGLGPYIFGNDGWASAARPYSQPTGGEHFAATVRRAFGSVPRQGSDGQPA